MRDAGYFAAALKQAPVRELQAKLVRRVPLMSLLESAALDFLFTSGKAYRYNPRWRERGNFPGLHA